jgi:3-oxoacyl-[acyl-carrier-protein] synthase III
VTRQGRNLHTLAIITALAEFKEKGRILQGKQVLFVSSISGLVAMSPQYG